MQDKYGLMDLKGGAFKMVFLVNMQLKMKPGKVRPQCRDRVHSFSMAVIIESLS